VMLQWWQGGKRHRLPIGPDSVARERIKALPPPDEQEESVEAWELEEGMLHWTPQEPSGADLVAHVMSPDAAPDPAEALAMRQELAQALERFGVQGAVGEFQQGPVVTRFAFRPGPGVKISKIVNLQRDIAMELAVDSIRVDVIPQTNLLGIEVPNRARLAVRFEDVLGHWQPQPHTLQMSIGVDIAGQPIHTDLVKLPHLLIAGATGSGKSVGLHGMLCSLMMRYTPAELKFCLIDTKQLEFGLYQGSRYLVGEVVTDHDMVMPALARELARTRRRYADMQRVGARDLTEFTRLTGRKTSQRIVIVIDELADLLAHDSKNALMHTLTNIVQISRAAGIHIIAATQRPSVDIVPGSLKAQFPARLTYKVASGTDSHVILGQKGGESLLGNGDGLLLAYGTRPVRCHAPLLTAAMVRQIVRSRQ